MTWRKGGESSQRRSRREDCDEATRKNLPDLEGSRDRGKVAEEQRRFLPSKVARAFLKPTSEGGEGSQFDAKQEVRMRRELSPDQTGQSLAMILAIDDFPTPLGPVMRR